ncbi:sigma-70 family RNA polymerase sigma factor [Verrucomicrobiota bacterium]
MKDDRDLVAEALEGGLEAFGEIVDRYRDAVFGVSLARLRNFHDAEDVAQTVFLEAFSKLDSFREPMKLGAWLRTIAIRRSIDLIRTRQEAVGIDEIERAEPEVGSRDLREQVLEAIGKLGKAQRETVTLYYINGYTVDEVATMQESPVGTVKRRLHEARKTLKDEMMKTVEGVLKSEAPKEDFGERVLDLLSRCVRPGAVVDGWSPVTLPRDEWHAVYQEIQKQIASAGHEGFLSAFESPHWRVRKMALGMAFDEWHFGGKRFDNDIGVLKKALADPNKKIRAFAINKLAGMDVDDELKQKEFVPLLLPMLDDKSERVRRVAAGSLAHLAGTVPWRVAARVEMTQHGRAKHGTMEAAARELLEAVIDAEEDETDKQWVVRGSQTRTIPGVPPERKAGCSQGR